MRRADRLFQILQYLRGGRLVTAAQLAERLEVTPRTIYRDIAHLIGSGVPIDGEAGVGYLMRDGYDLPPLMFSHNEIVALVSAARLLQAWGGSKMAAAAEEALVKIDAVLPEEARVRSGQVHVHAFEVRYGRQNWRDHLDHIEDAAERGIRLDMSYADAEGRSTRRIIRPLGVWFWGKVWTAIAWCELREAFRMFRLDRITDLQDAGRFKPEKGKTLKDFYEAEAYRDFHQ